MKRTAVDLKKTFRAKFLLISLKQISQNTGHSKFFEVRLTVAFPDSFTNLVELSVYFETNKNCTLRDSDENC